MKKFLSVVVGIGIAASAGVARPEVVASLPEGKVITMPPVRYAGAGPQEFDGVIWTSTNRNTYGGSVFGYDGLYGFGAYGVWTGALGPMAGLNSPADTAGGTDTMTFEFATPVSGVGGFMNYDPQFGNPVISVYDSGRNPIESHTLSFTVNGDDSGFFIGFRQDRAIIKYFTLSNSFIGITRLTTTTVASLPPAPAYSCLGFEPPMSGSREKPVKVKNQRVLPLKALLEDQYGSLLIDSDIHAPPVLRVFATSPGETVAHDVTDAAISPGQGAGNAQFVFTSEGKWQFNLATRNFVRPGTYSVSLVSGDDTEYRIQDGACRGRFVIE